MLKKKLTFKTLIRFIATALLFGMIGCGSDFDGDRRDLATHKTSTTPEATVPASSTQKKPIAMPNGEIIQIVNGKIVTTKPQQPQTTKPNQPSQPTQPNGNSGTSNLDPNAKCIGAPAEICTMEEAMAKYTNDYRRSKGLAALTFDPRVAYAARVWSQKSSQRGQVIHATPQDHMSVLRPAFPGVRFNLAAENMALSPSYHGTDLDAEAKGIVNLWINDKPHRDNLLGSFHQFGIGAHFAGGYWWVTQVFEW